MTTHTNTAHDSRSTRRTTHRSPFAGSVAALAALGVVALSGCGADDAAAFDDDVLEVEMNDFHYGELPERVQVGTELAVSNAADSELHEFVAFRLADDDERTVEEIMEGDVGAILGGGLPAMVHLAPPGSAEQIIAVGDGTFAEPGRYLILCAIPTGADPAEYLAAAAESEGPPQVDGGQPHFMNGMHAEIEVVG